MELNHRVNSFIWPTANDAQQAAVIAAAQAVLDARAKYPESTLVDLYDPLTMPPELSKAHARLDTLVDKPIDKLRTSSTAGLLPPTPTACRISSRSTLPP
jgi:hypothetical protein